MKQAVFLIMATLLFVSCATSKQAGTTDLFQKDSVRTEVRKEIIYVPDTVYLEIPAQSAERTTKDSTSNLENDYATSTARINPDGTLYHDLNTKPQDKPVPTEKEIERNDSIVYIDRFTEVPIPVEKELSWWEQTCIKWFPYSIGTLLLSLIVILRKPMLNLIRRFI